MSFFTGAKILRLVAKARKETKAGIRVLPRYQEFTDLGLAVVNFEERSARLFMPPFSTIRGKKDRYHINGSGLLIPYPPMAEQVQSAALIRVAEDFRSEVFSASNMIIPYEPAERLGLLNAQDISYILPQFNKKKT